MTLPHLRIVVSPSSGDLEVALDHQPYDVAGDVRSRGRDAVPGVVDEVVGAFGRPIRVDIVDEGSTYTDIIVPPTTTTAPPELDAARSVADGEVAGIGFSPREQVAVAVVVAHLDADAQGHARLRLPAALLADRCGQVVLLGHDSHTVVLDGTT